MLRIDNCLVPWFAQPDVVRNRFSRLVEFGSSKAGDEDGHRVVEVSSLVDGGSFSLDIVLVVQPSVDLLEVKGRGRVNKLKVLHVTPDHKS